MLKIELHLDVAKFDRDMDTALRGDVMPKVADFVNEVAEKARLAVQEAMREGLDRPTPFSLLGVKVFPVRATGLGAWTQWYSSPTCRRVDEATLAFGVE